MRENHETRDLAKRERESSFWFSLCVRDSHPLAIGRAVFICGRSTVKVESDGRTARCSGDRAGTQAGTRLCATPWRGRAAVRSTAAISPATRCAACADLARLPLTFKEHLRDATPYGMLAVPPHEAWHYHETSGTTGEPISTWCGLREVQRMGAVVHAMVPELSTPTVLLNRFPLFAPVSFVFEEALRHAGACHIAAGNMSWDVPFSRVLDFINRLEVTALSSLPLEPILLHELARVEGLDMRRDLGLAAGDLLRRRRAAAGAAARHRARLGRARRRDLRLERNHADGRRLHGGAPAPVRTSCSSSKCSTRTRISRCRPGSRVS